jgi:hypothetical protein
VALLGIMGALMGAVVTASCLLGRFGLDAATHSVMIDASQSDFAKNSRPTSSTWQPIVRFTLDRRYTFIVAPILIFSSRLSATLKLLYGLPSRRL